MAYVYAGLFSGIATLIVTVCLVKLFATLPVGMVSGYRRCASGWEEAYLHNCQAGLLKIPQQPVNTYSNLAYLTCGFFGAFHLSTLPSFVIALTLFYLCVGSALFHATSTWWAGRLDVSAIYATFSATMVFSISTLGSLPDPPLALLMFAVAVACAYWMEFRFRAKVLPWIIVFLVPTYVAAFWRLNRAFDPWAQTLLIVSLVLLGTAFLTWLLDKKRWFPVKGWGHGVWHILTAFGIITLFYAIHKLR